MTNPTIQIALAMREAAAKAIDHCLCDVAEDSELFLELRDYFAATVRATPLPEWTPEASEQCSRCQGNGEIVTNWRRYKHPRAGDKGDEAVAECPDCDGTGAVPSPRAEAAEIARIAADRDAQRASAISFHEEADRLRDSLARANADRDRLNSENDALVKDMVDLAGLAANATARTDEAADEREATIATLRTFVRNARRVIEMVARDHGYRVDPFGAHAWLSAEEREIGTARDGGDPKVEKRT